MTADTVCQVTTLIKLKQLHGASLPRIPGRKKNGGPKAAAVTEMLPAYAPFHPAQLSMPEEGKPDLSSISNGTNQLRIDILPLDLFQDIH